MNVSDAKRLKELETENIRPNKLPTEAMLENEVTRDVSRKNGQDTGTLRAGAKPC